MYAFLGQKQTGKPGKKDKSQGKKTVFFSKSRKFIRIRYQKQMKQTRYDFRETSNKKSGLAKKPNYAFAVVQTKSFVKSAKVRNFKQMKRLLFMTLFAVLCLPSCKKNETQEQGKTGKLTAAQGGKYYGGVFRLNESEYIKNLFPHSIIDVYSYRVASQIYEGLLKFDQDSLNLVNGLAESYTLDEETGTVYTFKLRKDVFFHNDECFDGGKGRKFTAQDVLYSFTLACTQSRLNQSFSLFEDIVEGANEYYTATASDQKPSSPIKGFKVIDDYTFQIKLLEPNSRFIFNLARPGAFIFPKEAYEKYGIDMRIKCVGTGPFKLSSVDEDISIILKKNENYYKKDEFGNQLPFLDALSIQFLKDKKVELLEFKKGNLDMMYRLPTDYLYEIIANESNEEGDKQYILTREPEMSTQCLLFFNMGKVFKDLNVRKAFSYAIDRETILNYVLSGEGFLEGIHGVTPPTFLPNYDIYNIDGFSFNRDSANYYLNKAGFPNGKGFPKVVLDINSEGDRFTNVAIELQKQLKENLNITLEINMLTLAQIADKAKAGNYQFLRVAWVADYPNPENYLWAFYGKNVPTSLNEESYPNMVRYKNPKFDEYYEKGLRATSTEKSFEYFMEAEKIMMRDAPVLVLWYDEAYRLLQPYVKDFPNNPMQYRDFSKVYRIPKETEKKELSEAALNMN